MEHALLILPDLTSMKGMDDLEKLQYLLIKYKKTLSSPYLRHYKERHLVEIHYGFYSFIETYIEVEKTVLYLDLASIKVENGKLRVFKLPQRIFLKILGRYEERLIEEERELKQRLDYLSDLKIFDGDDYKKRLIKRHNAVNRELRYAISLRETYGM